MKSIFVKDIPEDLGRRIKISAAEQGVKIRELIIAAVREHLDYLEELKEVGK